MKSYPDISMSISNHHSCIHYSSFENPWIDFYVIVPLEYEELAASIIVRAMTDIWDGDHQDECCGDLLECYLSKQNIPYIILYNSVYEEDAEYEEWWNKLVSAEHVKEVN